MYILRYLHKESEQGEEGGEGLTAREYLEKIWHNERIIRNKQIERKYWMELASGITASIGGERVQSTKIVSPMEKMVVEAAIIDQEIDRLKKEIAEIIETIQKLPTEEYDFLHKVYIQRKDMKEIYVDGYKSNSWAKTMHKRALSSLQRVLDERENAQE